MPNRNASDAAFGWEFQFNAGIVIMLANIKEAREIKIEGNTEDIEVYYSDGSVTYGQAKAGRNIEISSLKALTNALQTLSEASQKPNVRKLIFVTNRPDPFCKPKTILRFSGGYSCVGYNELPLSCQERVSELCNKHELVLPLEKFSVLVFDFSGDDNNRYRIVQDKIDKFLVSLDSDLHGFGERALERWQQDFGKNAAQKDRTKTISKKQMIWPLIVWLCNEGTPSWLNEFDTAEFKEIERRYGKVIDVQSERFALVSKIMTAFDQECCLHRDTPHRELIKMFIKDKNELFAEEFDLHGCPEEIARIVRQLTLERVLLERFNIFRIREAVRL